MSDLVAIRKNVPSVAAAFRSLTAMERELTTAKTYDTIRRVIKEATALKVLMGDVAEVKAAAEDAILIGNRRIAEELAKVPKASGGDRKSNLPPRENLKAGRAAGGIKATSRHRLGKLAAQSVTEIKATAARLREQGKDATVTAVVRELTQGSKKERRSERERELAKRQRALPDKKYGVVVADPEWQFEAWSEETGSDRAAANHYPVSTWQTIKERPVWTIAAKDAVLFMWATAPMLPQALEVMTAWGFRYRSHVVWAKDRIGTGYWFRNRHELLLVGARGNLPAPAPGTQWPSVVEAPVGRHSEKPEVFIEMIEAYFPSLPRIELNRRGPPRAGWDAWGNEIEAEAADD